VKAKKGKSNHAKARAHGNAWEKRILTYLESLGWTVDRAKMAQKCVGPGIWVSYSADFFGCLDLIAINAEMPYTLCIQATLGDIKSHKEKLEAVAWHDAAQRIQLWTRQDGIISGVRVLMLLPGKKKERTWTEHIWKMKDGVQPPQGVL